MKEYFVYMILCSDGSFYTGVTNDYQKRFAEHQVGIDSSCYTYRRRPLTLVHVESFADVRCAIAAEKQIKRWSRKKKEALICGDIAVLKRLARRRTPFASACHPEEDPAPRDALVFGDVTKDQAEHD